MTLLVFLGALVSLLILRLIPGLLLRLVLAIPRRQLIALVTSRTASTMRWARRRQVGIVLSRKSSAPQSDMQLVLRAAPFQGRGSLAPRRGRLVFVSSSILALAVLVTTAFWTWHSTGLMMLLH